MPFPQGSPNFARDASAGAGHHPGLDAKRNSKAAKRLSESQETIERLEQILVASKLLIAEHEKLAEKHKELLREIKRARKFNR